MTVSEIAKILGRKGGIQRAQRLSKQRRKDIAQLGSKARIESFRLARIIQSNFDHLAAIYELAPPPPVISNSKIDGRLPGIYAKE